MSYALPYLYGDLGLLMALGILPWVLYTLDRLAFTSNKRNIIFAAVALALFIVSDAQIAVLGGAVIGASLVSLNWRSDINRGFYRPIIVAVTCAVAISAFYWIPAI
jgi:hypothetical protein